MDEPITTPHAQPVYGQALLDQLDRGQAALPAKTIFALVLGGLRVRMMRSTITMVSIVLAIAFLMYTGLTNRLYHDAAQAVGTLEVAAADAQPDQAQLHQAEADGLRQKLRAAGINIQTTLKGDPMDTWLLVMALLTCAVGIANAMLMSVTERFREIGTMKCLGALDGLVVKLFLMESSFLGIVGAVMGIVFGVLVTVVAAMLQFGTMGLHYFPVAYGGWMALISVGAGIFLALFGTAGPAIMAARMRPVDALRVDE